MEKTAEVGINKQEVPLLEGRERLSNTQEEEKKTPPPDPAKQAGCCYAKSHLRWAFS
jgi:hypothetical protein